MRKTGTFTVFLCSAILLSGCTHGTPYRSSSPRQEMRPASEELDIERLKERVKEAIKGEPELIYNVVNRYVAEKRVEDQILEEFEEGFKNRVKATVYDSHPAKGRLTAPITIIAYTDFQSPICSEMAGIMDEIVEAYPESIRLVFKTNPSRSHPNDLIGVRAALAARKQGKFWEYHDLLFNTMAGLNERRLLKYARDVGLDMQRFNKDRNSPEIAKQIQADREEALKLGFKEPPAFIINGVVMKGMYPKKYFTTVIDYLLAEERESEQVRR